MEQQLSHANRGAPSGATAGVSSSFFDTHFGRGASEVVVSDDGGPNRNRREVVHQEEEEPRSHASSRSHVKEEPVYSSRNLVSPLPQPQLLLPHSLLQASARAAAASTTTVTLGESFFAKHFCSSAPPVKVEDGPDGSATPPVLPAKRPAPCTGAGHPRTPFPVPAPEGRSLHKRSWCCGQPKESSAPASLCSDDSGCPRWRCRYHTRSSEDQGEFSCCTHKPELKQGCQCHT